MVPDKTNGLYTRQACSNSPTWLKNWSHDDALYVASTWCVAFAYGLIFL